MATQKTDDRFKKFGTVSFMSISKVNDFIGFLEQGKVMATRCRHCGVTFFPPRADCCGCLASDMEWVEVIGEGTLLTCSKLGYAPVGFKADLPYTIALAQFKDVKVFGRMSNELSEADIKVGMKVTLSPVQLANGNIAHEFNKA